MKVSVLSMNDQKEKVSFQSEAIQEDNKIQFEDKSYPNTQIILSLLEESILLERSGDVQMHMHFHPQEITDGWYRNKEGLQFDYQVQTMDILRKNNKIKVTYILFLDHSPISTTTFQITFF